MSVRLQTRLYLFCLTALSLPAATPKGDEYLKVAGRSELRHDYQTAAQLCGYALEEDPRDLTYIAAAQRTRHLAAQELLSQGQTLAQDLRLKEALARFQSALRLEPDSPVSQDAVHQTEEKIRSLENAPRLQLEMNLIPHLKIASNTPRLTYRRVAVLAGFKVTFDASVVDSPEPTANQSLAAALQSREGEISGISVETALNAVAAFTHTSWRAVSSNSIYVTHGDSVAPHPNLVPAPNSFDIAALSPEDALPVAARLAKLADVVHLVLQGADVNAPGSFGIKPLTLAVTANDPEIVRFLLEHNAERDAQNALPVAISKGNPEIVNLLLSHGADVKDPNRPDRRTLLHEVCAQGSAPLIPLLVEFGADPTQRDAFAETPLDLAVANNNAKAVAALLKLAEQNKPIQRTPQDAMENATVHGYTDTARLLIENHFDINNPTPQGSTYLGDAALKAQTRMVRLLLDHGANVSLRNQFGGTALHDGALSGSVEVIKLLLDRGANPQLRDNSGHTALDLARESGNEEIIRILTRP